MNELGLYSLSNLYIDYYHGNYEQLGQGWKGIDVVYSYIKFYYITDGECIIEINGIKYKGCKGRMFIIPARTKHSFYHENDNYIKKYWIHCSIVVSGDSYLTKFNLKPYVDIKDDTNIVKYFNDILRLSKINTVISTLSLKARIIDLLCEYMTASQTDTMLTDVMPNSNFDNILIHISKNLHRNIKVEELAMYMYVHPNYFIKLFKRKMGETPLEYINHMRIERAKLMLINTKLPISVIMTHVGFNLSSSFSNFFKHYTGYRPSVFREIFGENNVDT